MTKIPKILIVDDEFGLADVVEKVLTENGYEVHVAINGALGLAAARSCDPDVILLDVMMPVSDGAEMLRALRREGWDRACVVVMSSLPGPPATLERDLYQRFLRKPFTEEELMEVVRGCLG